jgi:hypothetical protein
MAISPSPLAQASSNQAKPPQAKSPVQAGGKLDTGAIQAENLEEISKSKPTGLKETVVDELGDQREAMNATLLRLRAGLDTRKNQLFDPVLMATSAGFLRPTKTGSFGESLGYAAEGASEAAEKQLLRERENQKLELELAGKEMEFRQQLGGDQFVSQLLGGPKSSAPPPAAGAVTTPTGTLRVPNTTSPVDVATAPNPQQVLAAARQGGIKITDEILLLANRVAPKMLPALQEIRKSQEGEEKNRIEREKLGIDQEKLQQTTRKVIPRGTRTERDMTYADAKLYQAALDKYMASGDEQELLKFYDSKGWLDPEQVRGRKIVKDGAQPEPIPSSKSQSELDAEKEQMVETQKIRAKASEDRGNMVLSRGENAPNMESLATDVLSLTDSNTRAFNLMQNATVRDAVLRAVEQGADVGVGPMSVRINLPVRVALQGNKEYKLTKDDIAALQIFQQKQSAITAEMRKMARTPGEGATDKTEGQLYAAIGLLPTDSAKVLALKSEAMIQRARYDSRAAQLWSKFQEDNPNRSFTYFQNNSPEFKELQGNYVRTLNEMREKNADTFRTSPKNNAASPASSSTTAPRGETYSERLKRLQRESRSQ